MSNTTSQSVNDPDTKNGTNDRLRMRIAPMQSSDVPTLAELHITCHLPDKAVSAYLFPSRWALRDSASTVRKTLDYREMLEYLETKRVGHSHLLVCHAEVDGAEKPIGVVQLTFPGKRQDRSFMDWILGDYVYPIMAALGISNKGQ